MMSVRDKLGYSVGDFGFNLFWHTTTLYLLFYYTDVLEISNTVAGLIIMVALVWDGLIDPLIGISANRTRSRNGRYRPYILFGMVPLCLSFVAMFYVHALSGTALVAVTFAFHLLFRTAYALVNIPFVALSAELSADSHERSQIASYRIVNATLAALVVAGATLPLAGMFGRGDLKAGFFLVSIVYATVALGCFILCFRATARPAVAIHDATPKFAALIATMRANRPFQLLFAATMIGGIGSAIASKTLVYFFKYNLAAPAQVSTGLVVLVGMMVICTPLWTIIAGRTSKRFVWTAGGLIGAAAWSVLAVTAQPSLPFTLVVVAFTGIGASAFALTFWSMLPDTVEYGEWKTGVRAEGATFGLVVFAQKVALGLGIGALGIALDAIGYRANAVQTPETLASLQMLLTVPSAALGLASVAIIRFYPIDARMHADVVAQIAGRGPAVAPM